MLIVVKPFVIYWVYIAECAFVLLKIDLYGKRRKRKIVSPDDVRNEKLLPEEGITMEKNAPYQSPTQESSNHCRISICNGFN